MGRIWSLSIFFSEALAMEEPALLMGGAAHQLGHEILHFKHINQLEQEAIEQVFNQQVNGGRAALFCGLETPARRLMISFSVRCAARQSRKATKGDG